MHSRCSALPFFVFDFARSPTDGLQTRFAGVAHRECASRYASALIYNCGPSSCRSCMPCHHYASSRLSSPLISTGLLGFVKSSSRNMVTACNNSRICPLLLLVLQTRQKLLLAPPTPYCVIASNTSQLLDGLQALASLPQLIII